jgi:hypothetical protein
VKPSHGSFRTNLTRFSVDKTFAGYHNLRQNGAVVVPGQNVVRGQLLGYSGDTGLAPEPQLHFAVYKAQEVGSADFLQSIQVFYDDGTPSGFIPLEGNNVTGDGLLPGAPRAAPAAPPTVPPVAAPRVAPVATPRAAPSVAPSVAPAATPMGAPAAAPNIAPTAVPSLAPQVAPSPVSVEAPLEAPMNPPEDVPVNTPIVSSGPPTAEPVSAPYVSPSPGAAPSLVPVESDGAAPTTDSPIVNRAPMDISTGATPTTARAPNAASLTSEATDLSLLFLEGSCPPWLVGSSSFVVSHFIKLALLLSLF